MTEGGTTETDVETHVAMGRLPEGPLLSVAHHPDAGCLGRRCPVPDGEEMVLGRACSHFGPGTLDDGLVSRQHVRIARRGTSVRVFDLASRNGTFVNGERLTEAELQPGDILSVGPVLLLLHVGPLLHRSVTNPSLVGVSSALSQVIRQIAQAAPQQACVLVQGETGVGKELVATEIHRQSGLGGDLVVVNCGAISDGVVHSELFGHVRGAFSGAGRERAGLIRAADGGTFLLDEIGDASPALQSSLLRLLEQREYRPVGSDRLVTTDARLVAATHVPLEPAVESGRFRRDLYGRLNRWVIHVPPLRERREDIVPLAIHFAEAMAGRPLRLSRGLALALLRYPWPSNVRELRSVMERAVFDGQDGDELEATAPLVERLRCPGPPTGEPAEARAPVGSRAVPAAQTLERPPPETLRARLEALDCNVKALAEQLGVSRRTAYRWLEESSIDLRSLRDARR